MKTIKTIILFSVIGILSGCSLFITTAESQKSRQVIIIPKQAPITNISHIEINFKDLKLTPEEEKENYDKLNNLLIAKLKENKLYQVNGDMNGDTIKILVKRVNENLISKDLQAFVLVLNPKGESVTTGVYIERGDGYHGADYYREEFVNSLVKYLKDGPVVKQKLVQAPAPSVSTNDQTSQTQSADKAQPAAAGQ